VIWTKKEKEKEKESRKVDSSHLESKDLSSVGSVVGGVVGSAVVSSPVPDEPPQVLKVPNTSASTIDFRSPITTPASISSNLGLTEEQATRKLGGNIRSVLSEGTVINGKLTFDTPVKIDGKLSGEVFSTKALVVGKTGKINAVVNVETLIVLGEVEGQVNAKESIEILPGGKVSADINTKKLIITDAIFNGSCKMS